MQLIKTTTVWLFVSANISPCALLRQLSLCLFLFLCLFCISLFLPANNHNFSVIVSKFFFYMKYIGMRIKSDLHFSFYSIQFNLNTVSLALIINWVCCLFLSLSLCDFFLAFASRTYASFVYTRRQLRTVGVCFFHFSSNILSHIFYTTFTNPIFQLYLNIR